MAVSVQEFSAKIKAKYPEYQNVDDTVLAQKIVSKYPSYVDKVDFKQPQQQNEPTGSPLGALGDVVNNIGAGATDLVKTIGGGLYDYVAKPIIKGAAMVTAGGAGSTIKALGARLGGKSEAEIEAAMRQPIDIGLGLGNINPTTSVENTVGAAVDLGSTLIPGSSAGKLGTKMAIGATKGAVQGFGKGLQQEGATLESAGGRGLIEGAFSGAMPLFEGAAKKIGEAGYNALVPSTVKQKALDITRGFNLGESLSKLDIPVTNDPKKILAALKGKSKGLSDVLDAAIDHVDNQPGLVKAGESSGIIPATDLVENLKQQVLSHPKLRIKYGDYANVENSIQKVLSEFNDSLNGMDKLSLGQLQAMKKKLGSGLTSYFSKGDAAVTAKDLTNDFIRNKAQTIIEKHVPAAAAINKELAPILTSIKRISNKGPSSGYLTDVVAGSASAAGNVAKGNFGAAAKDALMAIGLKRLASSGLRKTAQGAMAKQAQKALANPFVKLFLRSTFGKTISGD